MPCWKLRHASARRAARRWRVRADASHASVRTYVHDHAWGAGDAPSLVGTRPMVIFDVTTRSPSNTEWAQRIYRARCAASPHTNLSLLVTRSPLPLPHNHERSSRDRAVSTSARVTLPYPRARSLANSCYPLSYKSTRSSPCPVPAKYINASKCARYRARTLSQRPAHLLSDILRRAACSARCSAGVMM